MADAPLIQMNRIHKSYDMGETEVHAIRGVSLRIDAGEFVAVMGPSGSGKTTLMNIVGCLDRPDRGEYLLQGQDVSRLSDDELADVRGRLIGFVFQQFNLLARTSAQRNVEMPMLYSTRKADRRLRARECLEAVALLDRAEHKPNELSGGQQQRVAIARALVNDPPVILADEPTGNLDSRSGEEIMALFQNLHDAGKTVILVTHDPDIARHTKRTIRFRDGHIVSDEPVKDRLMAHELLASMPVDEDLVE